MQQHPAAPGFELDTKVVGAFPLVNQILKRLRFDDVLRKHLPPPDPRALLSTRAPSASCFATSSWGASPFTSWGSGLERASRP